MPRAAGSEVMWFVRRTREVLGVAAVALTGADETVLAGRAPAGPGWLAEPVRCANGETAAALHVLPGRRWCAEESEAALTVATGTAARLLARPA